MRLKARTDANQAAIVAALLFTAAGLALTLTVSLAAQEALLWWFAAWVAGTRV